MLEFSIFLFIIILIPYHFTKFYHNKYRNAKNFNHSNAL